MTSSSQFTLELSRALAESLERNIFAEKLTQLRHSLLSKRLQPLPGLRVKVLYELDHHCYRFLDSQDRILFVHSPKTTSCSEVLDNQLLLDSILTWLSEEEAPTLTVQTLASVLRVIWSPIGHSQLRKLLHDYLDQNWLHAVDSKSKNLLSLERQCRLQQHLSRYTRSLKLLRPTRSQAQSTVARALLEQQAGKHENALKILGQFLTSSTEITTCLALATHHYFSNSVSPQHYLFLANILERLLSENFNTTDGHAHLSIQLFQCYEILNKKKKMEEFCSRVWRSSTHLLDWGKVIVAGGHRKLWPTFVDSLVRRKSADGVVNDLVEELEEAAWLEETENLRLRLKESKRGSIGFLKPPTPGRLLRQHLERDDLVLCTLRGRTELAHLTLNPKLAGQRDRPEALSSLQTISEQICQFHNQEFPNPDHWVTSQPSELLPCPSRPQFQKMGIWNLERSLTNSLEKEQVELILHPYPDGKPALSAYGWGGGGVASLDHGSDERMPTVACHEFYHALLSLEHSEIPRCIMNPKHKSLQGAHLDPLQKAICLRPQAAFKLEKELERAEQAHHWDKLLHTAELCLKSHSFHLKASQKKALALAKLDRRQEWLSFESLARQKFGERLFPRAKYLPYVSPEVDCWLSIGPPYYREQLVSHPSLYDELNNALLRMSLGDFGRALSGLERVEAYCPDSLLLALTRFELLHQLGEPAAAELLWRDLRRAGILAPPWGPTLLPSLLRCGLWEQVLCHLGEGELKEKELFSQRGLARLALGEEKRARADFLRGDESTHGWLLLLDEATTDDIIVKAAKATLGPLLMALTIPASRWQGFADRCLPAASSRLKRLGKLG